MSRESVCKITFYVLDLKIIYDSRMFLRFSFTDKHGHRYGLGLIKLINWLIMFN